MAVILALGAAFANALTSILQRAAAEDAPAEDSFRLRLIVYLLKRPVWLAGIAAMTAGFLFQVTALRFGQMSTVQPLLTGEIVFLLVIMWAWFRVPLGRSEWISGCAIALGLGTFLSVAHPDPGRSIPTGYIWMFTAIACAVSMAVTSAVGLTLRHGTSAKSALFGSAGAVAFAFTAAVMKDATTKISQHGWTHLFQTWVPYTVVGAGIVGMFLAQNAFHAGPISASQSALTIVDPLASILIGVTVFGDQIQTGGWQVTVESLSLAVMVVGVVFLTRSQTITGARFENVAEAPGREILSHLAHGDVPVVDHDAGPGAEL